METIIISVLIMWVSINTIAIIKLSEDHKLYKKSFQKQLDSMVQSFNSRNQYLKDRMSKVEGYQDDYDFNVTNIKKNFEIIEKRWFDLEKYLKIELKPEETVKPEYVKTK